MTRRSVLMLHAEYRVPGGEETVVETECALLKKYGHTVTRLTWSNRDIRTGGASSLGAAANAIWNRSALQDVRAAIARHAPDVVHVHNTFPSASPAVIRAGTVAGIPVVQTIHNFRLMCINGMLFRDGKPCELCVGRSVWRGVLYGCYRGSRTASIPVAMMTQLHRAMGTWKNRVAHYLAVSERVRDVLLRSGIPAEKVTVRRHYLEADPGLGSHDGGYTLIASRLSPEKGIAEATAAWMKAGVLGNLVIAGDGPERQRLTEIANGDPRIVFTGHVDRRELARLMSNARILLVPSLWEEPAAPPLAAVEAIATGLPVVASGAGGLGEWVRRTHVGWTAPPGDAVAWAEILRDVGADEAGVRMRGRAAREEFLRSHSASACIRALVDTYDKVCARRQGIMASDG